MTLIRSSVPRATTAPKLRRKGAFYNHGKLFLVALLSCWALYQYRYHAVSSTAQSSVPNNKIIITANNNEQKTVKIPRLTNNKSRSDNKSKKKTEIIDDQNNDKDIDCPFRDSPLYRSIFVYPNPHTEATMFAQYRADNNHTTTTTTTTMEWPWILQRNVIRKSGTFLYDIDNPSVTQFALDVVVYDMIANSCLRTWNADEAQLFLVPFWPSVFRRGGHPQWSHDAMPHTSIYEEALAQTIIMASSSSSSSSYDEKTTNTAFEAWERVFGLTSRYWKRRHGTDHVIVMPEPLHGLFHPRGKRGFHHYIKTQKQLWSPIVVSVEVSQTFLEQYPKCTRKNILVPYPNIDGKWYNTKWNQQANRYRQIYYHDNQQDSSRHSTVTAIDNSYRPLLVYYKAGNHGECLTLRQALKINHLCDNPTDTEWLRHWNVTFPVGMRLATFCPCPGGDSPSAKRVFDAVLAGCIPVILSHDFVWPFTINTTINTTISASSTVNTNENLRLHYWQTNNHPRHALDPNSFAIHLNAQDFSHVLYKKTRSKNGTTVCQRQSTANEQQLQLAKGTLQEYLRSTISHKQVAILQKGLQQAAHAFSYFALDDTSIVDNPLQAGMLPSGGAAHRLVDELALRAKWGSRLWEECRLEKTVVAKRNGGKMVTENKC